ncbi:MAG: HPr(Ser) kinase/phosphatase [Christensenellales bacterium]|jgi:HPr kinase/phosphorylase|nr:HPr(Ser) kinase/phosphatase [Clostridiales bacterium]
MVNAKDFVKSLKLIEILPAENNTLNIASAEFNRPGLELLGYYDHFAYKRPQVFGNVEMTYLASLSKDHRRETLDKFFSYPIPCVVVCRDIRPGEDFIGLAKEHSVAVYRTQEATTTFIVSAILYLMNVLAPRTTTHAVLVDVFGTGVLITGESGVGKSETALELVSRGHQLVADDVVEIKRVSDNRLIGEAPETIRHFMEIRGIGIIDIRQMFGVGSVLTNKAIDMSVHLENWQQDKEYDRLGMEETFTTILDVSVPHLVIPVRPGRNLSIIIEIAARNHSLRRFGYSAAHELDKRLIRRMRGERF